MNLHTKKRPLYKSEQGMATIETIPLLIIFLILLSYAIGYFGAIHTGILHSIAARNYAFETFRHRPNLTYFRDRQEPRYLGFYYQETQVRFHSISSGSADDQFMATERPISVGLNSSNSEKIGRDSQTHNNRVPAIASNQRNADESVNPIWVKTSYGICINAACGE